MAIPSPGPGGFATSGPFAVPPGVHLAPARTRAVPGVRSGPAAALATHGPAPWLWLLAALAVVTAAALLARRWNRRAR
jgi:hypothetical protein